MYSVAFEIEPEAMHWDAYQHTDHLLRSDLERMKGFVDSVRYKSLTREGWILSLSTWQDERAIARWRSHPSHYSAQERGRNSMLKDYHLRVGPIINDTSSKIEIHPAPLLPEPTEAGEGAAIVLIDASRPSQFHTTDNPADCSEYLGLNPYSSGLVSWDVLEALSDARSLILLQVFATMADATAFEDSLSNRLPPDGRLRRMLVVRDYGMSDRREAPQYFPPR